MDIMGVILSERVSHGKKFIKVPQCSEFHFSKGSGNQQMAVVEQLGIVENLGRLMKRPGFPGLECGECERLLVAYTHMTREYLNLMRRRKTALLERGWTALGEIDSILASERERRASAKKALLNHDYAHRTRGG